MKIAITTDTHYGRDKNTHRVHEKFLTRLNEAMKAEDVKVLIHCGDWSCNKQDQLERTLKMFRKHIDIPIVAVIGNHDLWQYNRRGDAKKKTLQEQRLLHAEWFKLNNIHYLENGPFVIEDVVIAGFDGWYSKANPDTNDADNMKSYTEAVPTMVYLSNYAHKRLDALLQLDLTQYRKRILVTHFPPFTDNPVYVDFNANHNYFQPMKEKFDVICVGHSHQTVNRVEDGKLILNAGAGYNEPRFLIVDI